MKKKKNWTNRKEKRLRGGMSTDFFLFKKQKQKRNKEKNEKKKKRKPYRSFYVNVFILFTPFINLFLSPLSTFLIYSTGDHSSIPGRVIRMTQKLYLIPPWLTLSNIRYGSRVSGAI